MDKVKELIIKSVNRLKPTLLTIDTKIGTLIPNPKLKKMLYIGMGSLFGFMFLIIILGLLLSPLRRVDKSSETTLNKPNIITSSPEPTKELTQRQKEIMDLRIRINEIKFPPSILNIPMIESGINI
jgi:hypothetical protein